MPARRKQPVAREEPCGSGQTSESLAADRAAQPRLLAAAATRKAGLSTPIQKKSNDKRKLFNLATLAKSSPSSTPPSDNGKKESKATFALMEATYQKGEKAGLKSGAIYYNGKPRFGSNKVYKEKVEPKLLAERLRWNDDKKFYSAKIYSYEQAVMILDAMRMVSAKDEEDLADVTIDETIFGDAPQIQIFPLTMETAEHGDALHTAIAGVTFPFKDELKKAGFSFAKNINDVEGAMGWLRLEPEAQAEVTTVDLKALFEKYGFKVDEYDGIDEDEDDKA